MIIAAIVLMLNSAAPAVAEPEYIEGPVKMTPAQIRDYNSHLSRDHPNYIRCERVEETGSLVRKKKVCRTNQEWARIEDGGNRDARAAVEDLTKGWSNGSPPTLGGN
jgi:hypothetical protein